MTQKSTRTCHWQSPDWRRAEKRGRTTETPTGCESPARTGLDRAHQRAALWDIVCLILPFVSAHWNACPGEKWSLCAQTTLPSRGEGAVNSPQSWGAAPESPCACRWPWGSPGNHQAFICGFILFHIPPTPPKKESSCEGCT